MPDRERLIEILKLGSCPSPYLCDENCKYANLERCYEERTADLLLEHGIIVPPCKVGDKVKVDARTYGNTWNYKTGDGGKYLLGETVSRPSSSSSGISTSARASPSSSAWTWQ